MYPIKLSTKTEIVPIVLIIAAFLLGVYFYSHFPAQVVSHWNFAGQPDGYGNRTAMALGIPFLLLGIYLLFLALPFLDPKKDRYQEFAKPFHMFKASIIFVLFGVFVASGLYNLGYNVAINVVIPLLIGLLMILLGNYMGKLKKNWFVGIRTPWTLSSENVWNKTHRLGGWMFMLFGVLLIISPFLPKILGFTAFIVGLIAVVVVTMVYSYLEYRKEQGGM